MARQDCDQKDLCPIKPDACPGGKDCASFENYHLKEVGKAIREAMKPNETICCEACGHEYDRHIGDECPRCGHNNHDQYERKFG